MTDSNHGMRFWGRDRGRICPPPNRGTEPGNVPLRVDEPWRGSNRVAYHVRMVERRTTSAISPKWFSKMGNHSGNWQNSAHVLFAAKTVLTTEREKEEKRFLTRNGISTVKTTSIRKNVQDVLLGMNEGVSNRKKVPNSSRNYVIAWNVFPAARTR